MKKLFAAVLAIFGSTAAVQTDAAVDDPVGRKRASAPVAIVTQDKLKEAVRANDLTALQEMLDTKLIGLSDELGGGRGLLQFAVMVDAVKSARFLVAAGAAGSTKDSMGSTAVALARKRGNQAMIRVVEGTTSTSTAA